MVYQGTVLGPPLWNLFFASCRHCVNEHDFREVVFADDLNCYRKFHRDFSKHQIFKSLHASQDSVHKWGEVHQVEFEPSKESLHILCRKKPVGGNFKILGILFDTKLVMFKAIVCIVAEASARIKMIRSVRNFYQTSELIALYKSHVLSFLESGVPAYYHARSSILKLVDEV